MRKNGEKTVYTIDSEKIFWRKVERETVILNVETGLYYTLDEIGSSIWDDLIRGRDTGQIGERMIAEYETDPGRIRKDVDRILRELSAERLIQKK